jgi:hypothetical protein
VSAIVKTTGPCHACSTRSIPGGDAVSGVRPDDVDAGDLSARIAQYVRHHAQRAGRTRWELCTMSDEPYPVVSQT